jgi:hypothetical protein
MQLLLEDLHAEAHRLGCDVEDIHDLAMQRLEYTSLNASALGCLRSLRRLDLSRNHIESLAGIGQVRKPGRQCLAAVT